MKTFQRFLATITGDQTVDMPAGAMITGLTSEHGRIYIHTLSDVGRPLVRRRIGIYLDGQTFSGETGSYVGQVLAQFPNKAAHVFDRGELSQEASAPAVDTKLYRVQISYEVVVVADDPEHARRVAQQTAAESVKDKEPNAVVCGRLTKLLDLHQLQGSGWDGECIPYGQPPHSPDRDKTIQAYINEAWE